MKRYFAFLAVIVLTFCSMAQADIVMSLTKLTNESDIIAVSDYGSVKYAINYGGTNVSGPISGITFVNQSGTTMYYSRTTSSFYNTAEESYASHNNKGTSVAGNTYSGTSSAELNKLLSSMIYNDGEPKNGVSVLTFGNLEEGKTYTARLLARSWTINDNNRTHEFSIDTNADGIADSFTSTISGSTVTGQQVSEDNPFLYAGEGGYTGAYAVDFTFTAQCNTASISLKSMMKDNSAWHNYGVMLIENSTEQVKPTTPTIYNPSFEADSFVIRDHNSQHGYIYENNSGLVSGWQFTCLDNNDVRLGLAWTGSPCTHFLSGQTPTDGKQVAFIQSTSNGRARMYQNVSGFDPESDTVYRLTMDFGRRTGTGNASASVFIGANQATESAYISGKTISGSGFKTYSTVFRPNATTQTIAIQNQTSGDTSLLVDNVQLKAYEMNTFFSDNYHVYNNKYGTEIGGPTSNDYEDRFEGGLLGGLGYSYSAKNNYQVQVNNGDAVGYLFLASNSTSTSGQTHVSPNYNFNSNMGTTTVAEEGGRMYEISFKVKPVYDDSDASNWAAILFGMSESKRMANVNTSDGVGILLRKNGGVQAFDGGTMVCDKGAGTVTLADGWADVRIDYYVPDFNESSKVDVTLYINDKLITTFQTSTGFTANYIQLEGYSATSNSAWARTLFDDFQVKSSANYKYDVASDVSLTKNWELNGKDKHHIEFLETREGSASTNHTGNLAMSGDSYIDVADDLTFVQSGQLTGTGALEKVGDGTLALATSSPDYTGTLKMSEGHLKLGADDSIARISLGSNLTLSDGDMEFDFSAGGTGWDQLIIAEGKTFTLDNNGKIVIDFADEPLLWLQPGMEFLLVSDNGFQTGEVNLDKFLADSPYNYYFHLLGNETGLYLAVDNNAIPEPSTWALLILGFVGLMWRLRSEKRETRSKKR